MNKGFSERLSKAIQALGIKPTHFAYKARVPQGTISKCLNGHVPTARILLRFSKTSGRSVDWLLTGKEQGGVGRQGSAAGRQASYGTARKFKAGEEAWVDKLIKILRRGNRRKKQIVKDLLNAMGR